MHKEQRLAQKDPIHHTANLKRMLTDVIEHARKDVGEISDPKAQALFETTAEVLSGIKKALEDFEQGNERAWKRAS